MFQWCKHLSYGGRLYSSSWAFEVVFGLDHTLEDAQRQWDALNDHLGHHVALDLKSALLISLESVPLSYYVGSCTWQSSQHDARHDYKQAKRLLRYLYMASELPNGQPLWSQGTLVRGCSNNGIWILPRDLVIDRHDVVWRLKAEGHSSVVCTDCLRAIPAQGGGNAIGVDGNKLSSGAQQMQSGHANLDAEQALKYWNTLQTTIYVTGLQSLALCLLTHHD